MASRKKTWTEKLNVDKQPVVKHLEEKFGDIPAGSDMLIPTPQMVDAYIRQIPEGITTSVVTMRKDLAAMKNADHSCPLVTGIFLRIVAEAAYERYQQTHSMEGVTPFWRVIEPDSALARKLSFGTDFIIEQRAKEHKQTGRLVG